MTKWVGNSGPLKVGVIGVGHHGQHHARLFSQLSNVMLAGVMDVDPERLDHIAGQFDTKPFATLAPLLQEVQAVSIAVPTTVHLEIARQCLEAGVHVLVEKPLALTSQEGRELDVLARKHDCILQVGHIERFNPVWRDNRISILSPLFIDIQRLSPFPHRGTDVDVVRDLMIHDLDLLLSLELGAVQSVQAVGMVVRSSHIDCAHATLQFERNCTVNLTANRISQSRVRRCSVLQQNAFLEMDFHTRRCVITGRNHNQDHPFSDGCEEKQSSDVEPLKLELEAFLDSVNNGTPSVVSGQEGTACLELAELILEAMVCPEDVKTLLTSC